LEVAGIFRDLGSAWRHANQGRLSHAQLKVMSAIEGCRTAALGGHIARCENPACGHTAIAYCSCRDRHCPKCQGKGFHRIRHYGLLASSRTKADTIERARELIAATAPSQPPRSTKSDQAPVGAEATDKPEHPCPCCGGRMVIIEMFEAGSTPRHRPTASAIAIRVDTS
jgi:hypothetical protein